MLQNDSGKRHFQTSSIDGHVAVDAIRMQLPYTSTERRHANVPVECTNGSCDFASAFILNHIDVPGGYRMALIARVMNGQFPNGYFLLVLGNSIRHMISAMRADMGAPATPDSEFANTRVIHPSPAHGLSNNVEALHEMARGLSYHRVTVRVCEVVEESAGVTADVAVDNFYDNWPSQRYD